jgi:hypothetical protein
MKRRKCVTVEDLFYNLVDMFEIFEKNEFVLDLARDLVRRGCRVPSALWIAMKFDGVRDYPSASILSHLTGISKRGLIAMEREDLQMIDYRIQKRDEEIVHVASRVS